MTVETVRMVGPPVDRVDGPLKVTGAAHYPADFSFPNLAHAVLVQSTVAAGRIRRISTRLAESAPGVLAVITHEIAPRLGRGPTTSLGVAPPPPLQDDRILHHGQHIAVVVAETPEQAAAAVRLLEVDYELTEPLLDLDDPQAERITNPSWRDIHRGDAGAALASAEVRVEATYTTATETNNPLGLFATIAAWEGDTLTVHDTTQWPYNVRATLAAAFGVPEDRVRVIAPFIGGAFGAGLRTWPHVVLAALAARWVNRPVKLVLNRAQMFTSVGYRPSSVQHLKIGATHTGELVALDHESIEPLSLEDNYLEGLTRATPLLYECPNVTTRQRQVRLNVACPTWMRGPGEAPGVYALECILDELAYELNMNPLEVRLRNYAETHPQSGLPWTSKGLRACYEQGAERFGWSRRTAEPRSMREGRMLVGLGMASAYYPYFQFPTQARATLDRAGTALVRSAATDIGTGTYTIMTQVSAEVLGLPIDRVRFELGDTTMPPAPQQGGSNLAASLGSAVHAACMKLVQAFLDVVRDDPGSPVQGCSLEDVTVADGRISRADAPERGEEYTDILERHGLAELTADGESAIRQDLDLAPGIFGAKFAEVHIDPDLGLIRVARIVAAIDGGHILNEKTATSQIIGGTVGGIGMALLEETVSDPRTGRIANATFGDYLVPVNADVPDIEVIFVGEAEPLNPLGVKGVGEIAIVGVAPAIANAVFHATGQRIRSLPITLDQLL
ncbi:MAG: xanthine dehydrogenase YagR molybdenum-binding subunit [Rubrobacteraceae bacterium]|nr:xanthine dehydrogenase YagR molybdenum-binding subunit [Rubrobacteraceae bacterium]